MKTDDFIILLSTDSREAQAQFASRSRLALGAVAASIVAVAVGYVAGVGVRPDISDAPVVAAVLRKEFLAAVAAISGLAFAWSMSRPTTTRAFTWLVPALVLAAFVAWELAGTGMAGWKARTLGRNWVACLAMIPLIAALPLAALLAALKLRAPGNPGGAGAAAGLAAAGIGAAIYATHCTDDSMLFVACWYTLATLVLVGAGALAGHRWLRW